MSNRHINETGDRAPACNLLAETMMFEFGEVTQQQDAFETVMSIMDALESISPALFKNHRVMHAEEVTCFSCGDTSYKRIDILLDGRYSFEYKDFMTSDNWSTSITSTIFMNKWIQATQKSHHEQRHCNVSSRLGKEKNRNCPDWRERRNEYLNAIYLQSMKYDGFCRKILLGSLYKYLLQA